MLLPPVKDKKTAYLYPKMAGTHEELDPLDPHQFPIYNEKQVEERLSSPSRNRITRNLKTLFLLSFLALLLLVGIELRHIRGFKIRSNQTTTTALEQLLREVPLIGKSDSFSEHYSFLIRYLSTDSHNDFPIWIRAFYQNHIYQQNFTEDGSLFGQVDFPRLRNGRLGGQFWSVYIDWYDMIHDLYPLEN